MIDVLRWLVLWAFAAAVLSVFRDAARAKAVECAARALAGVRGLVAAQVARSWGHPLFGLRSFGTAKRCVDFHRGVDISEGGR